jgi:agmatine/peptidylarginine deiminase
MISDRDTDRVYFSDLLPDRYPDLTRELISVLELGDIITGWIPGTQDIWCRDYMPVQLDAGRFVQFRYTPGYLRGGYEHLITQPEVARAVLNGAACTSSSIVLDGGNVVGWGGHVLMTERIYRENPNRTPKVLRAELTDRLEVERLTVIPAEPGDLLGHADGIVRFLDAGVVLVNDYRRASPGYRRRLLACLRRARLDWVELPFCPADSWVGDMPPATGVYVNFLRVRGLLAVPQYDLPVDEEALRTLEHVLPGVTVVPVLCGQLALEGGALNCASWNIATAIRADRA